MEETIISSFNCKMKIVTIYEAQHTDGYSHFGGGVYFLSESEAASWSKTKYGGYAVAPQPIAAIDDGNGRYYILKSVKPVSILGTQQAKEDLAKAALSKLTKEEIEALGL